MCIISVQTQPVTGLWMAEGSGLPAGSGWDPAQFPFWACRWIRPQTFLGSFGNCTGPLTYGPDKNLSLRDKELFKGI